MPCWIKLISLGVWARIIATELILYKTIIVSYQLLFQCVLLSDYFTLQETNANTVFIFLCSVQHDKLYVFAVLQIIFFISNIVFIYTTIIFKMHSYIYFFHLPLISPKL